MARFLCRCGIKAWPLQVENAEKVAWSWLFLSIRRKRYQLFYIPLQLIRGNEEIRLK
jgi:hypothetical protein